MTHGSQPTPAARARIVIDRRLVESGWVVQDRDALNVHAARGVAVREFALASGFGFADYLLFVDGKAVGVLGAKSEGHTLGGVERQTDKYSRGLPRELTAPLRPLPFLYRSTGVETQFAKLLDPDARSREVFAVHRPKTLSVWLGAATLDAWVRSTSSHAAADNTQPSSLRAMPELQRGRLYSNQIESDHGA